MTDIRAFIGHSFLKSDADIVAKLLKHFDRISKLIPRFSWENAEAAEPKQLADKVMALIDDKNTFIGICTKREKVIESKLLSTMFLSPYVKALPEDFEWKTSDWIIQEIGMANARGLEMILLVEEGVRKPGGLQGDVEYVSFERDSPEKSFDKILEMIAALSPKSAALSTASQETKRSAEEIEKQTTLETEDKDWKTPASDWDVQDYERAMFEMIANENAKGTEKINKAYLGTTNATEGDNKVIWGARKEWLQILF